MKTNGFKIFFQPCTQVSIFLLHFRAKIKLTLYFYFQIPAEIKQPWQTSAIQQKAYPAEWGQNKATINRKRTLKHSKQPIRKKSLLPFHSRQTTEWQHHTWVPKPQQVLVSDHICWKPPTQYNDERKLWHVIARAVPSVSSITRWGGTGWFNYIALDEPYKAHFARTCIRLEVNRLLFVRLNF